MGEAKRRGNFTERQTAALAVIEQQRQERLAIIAENKRLRDEAYLKEQERLEALSPEEREQIAAARKRQRRGGVLGGGSRMSSLAVAAMVGVGISNPFR